MMIFSLVAMIGLAKCCITSACLQWLCHSGERIVARGPLVLFCHAKPTIHMKCQDLFSLKNEKKIKSFAAIFFVALRVEREDKKNIN